MYIFNSHLEIGTIIILKAIIMNYKECDNIGLRLHFHVEKQVYKCPYVEYLSNRMLAQIFIHICTEHTNLEKSTECT